MDEGIKSTTTQGEAVDPASALFAPAIMGRLLVEAKLQNMPWLNDVARLIGDMSVALIALTPHHSGACCRQREDGSFVVTEDKCCCRPMEKLSRQITGHDAPVDWANGGAERLPVEGGTTT